MKWYLLAFIVWISIILMIVSIIGIPFWVFLRDNSEWFEHPFEKAWEKDWLEDE